MPSCCKLSQPPSTQKSTGLCPHCDTQGKPVGRQTVDALVRSELRHTLNGEAYAFCETSTCPVVYYSPEGARLLKHDLRVRVGIKEIDDPIPVCYCFGVTKRMIREEMARTGRSRASQRIRAEVKAGNCRCEVESPSGRCCLGDVIQEEKHASPERPMSPRLPHIQVEGRSEMSASRGATHHTPLVKPAATETAMKLVSLAESMLGGRSSQAGIGPQEEAVRRYILTQYPLLGRAPTRQEIAAALALRSLPELDRMLERLHAVDSLYLDSASQEIRLTYPFSSVPTNHVVEFPDWDEAKPVYAQCAVDALGIPFMIGRHASITSSCAHCGDPIALDVRNGAIVAYQPAATVVWVGTSRSDHAATSCCPTMNFFCSSAHSQAWRQHQPDPTGYELTLGEALYLGKGIFEALLEGTAGAAPSRALASVRSESGHAAPTVTTISGLVAAFLASLCCLGPAVFAALGVGIGATGVLASTAGFLKTLLPYRPWFIGLTVGFLAVSFYLVYRQQGTCATKRTCVPGSKARVRKTFLWILSATALALILAPYWLGL